MIEKKLSTGNATCLINIIQYRRLSTFCYLNQFIRPLLPKQLFLLFYIILSKPAITDICIELTVRKLVTVIVIDFFSWRLLIQFFTKVYVGIKLLYVVLMKIRSLDNIYIHVYEIIFKHIFYVLNMVSYRFVVSKNDFYIF